MIRRWLSRWSRRTDDCRFRRTARGVCCDCTVREVARDADGHWQIDASGRCGDARLGFRLSLAPHWKRSGIEDHDGHFHWGKARWISLGGETDAWLAHWARAADCAAPAHARGIVELDVVALADDPATLPNRRVRLKAMADAAGGRGRYAEVLIDIDLAHAQIRVHESRPDYRQALLRAWSSD